MWIFGINSLEVRKSKPFHLFLRDGKDASKKEHFEPILKEIEGKILKIPTFAAKVKEALTAVYQELYK